MYLIKRKMNVSLKQNYIDCLYCKPVVTPVRKQLGVMELPQSCTKLSIYIYISVTFYVISKLFIWIFIVILCSVWLSNKMAKAFTLYSTKWYASAFALRQRMLNFVQNFEYYMMFEVVEPHWHVFESNMNEVLTFTNWIVIRKQCLHYLLFLYTEIV